jgi:hypothetical protein
MRKIFFSFLSVYLGVEEDVGIPGVELPVVLLAVGHRAEILTAEIAMVPFYEYFHSKMG